MLHFLIVSVFTYRHCFVTAERSNGVTPTHLIGSLDDLWNEMDHISSISSDQVSGELLEDLLNECKNGFISFIRKHNLTHLLTEGQDTTTLGRKVMKRASKLIAIHPPPSREVIDCDHSRIFGTFANAGGIDENFVSALRSSDTSSEFDAQSLPRESNSTLNPSSSQNLRVTDKLQHGSFHHEANYSDSIAIDDLISLVQTHSCQLKHHPTICKNKTFTENIDRPHNLIALGKRGRYYMDVWDEEAFIRKNDLTVPALSSWSDLINGYHDDFDSSYKDHMIKLTGHRRYFDKVGTYAFV